MARHSLDAVPRLKIVRDAIPDDLEVVIERALEKVPADRYQTSGEFVKALTAASTGHISRITAARRPPRARALGPRPIPAVTGSVLIGALAWVLFGRLGGGGSSGSAAW